MTTDIQQQAGRQAGDGASLVERLGERIGVHARAEMVYGDPVERGGVTVIPVARVRWGFGGGFGSGSGPDRETGQGGGGGGGVTASPAGYIEIKNGTTEFKPIRDLPQMLLAIAVIVSAGGFATVMLLRGLRGLLRD